MRTEQDTIPSGLALVELAEAEAADAEARADAAKARARAVRLRHELDRQVDSGIARTSTDEVGTDEADTGSAEFGEFDAPDVRPERRRRRLRRPTGRIVVISVAVIGLVALLAANGFLAWHHYGANRDRERAVEFTAAASQGVVNMTTLDFGKAEADVARVLDSTTGEFRADFASRVDEYTSAVRDSKVITTGAVTSTAVESMTKDSAVVLVSATSTLTNAQGVKEEPRKWRLSVTVSRDGDQLKMSKVEFVP